MMASVLASCTTTGKVFVSQKDYKVTAIVEKKPGKCVVEATNGTQRLYFVTDCQDGINDVYQITKH
jgi:hypothetical protein